MTVTQMGAAHYLRKSRMEKGIDTEEVLSKHRKALAEYATAHGGHIIETYYEVVSGESLYARSEMPRLLEDVEEEAKFVRMMYEMYVDGFGCVSIARHINSLGAKPRRTDAFSRSSVANILKKPTYIVKIVWDQKKHIRKGSKGNPKHITIYQPREQWTIVNGIHPAIVSKELYDKAQAVMAGRYIPASNDGTVRNPLAGLVRCANCGHHMQRMAVGTKQPYLLCNTPGCCASAKFDLMEQAILDHLAKLLAELSVAKPTEAVKGTDYQEARLETLQKEAAAAEVQKGRLYDLLEQGVYDVPTFRERMEKVKARLSLLDREIASLQRAIRAAQQTDPAVLAARIQAVLDAYQESDPAHRNALLRSVFEVVWYAKDKKSKPTDFSLHFDLNAN